MAGPGLGGDGRRAPALDLRPPHRLPSRWPAGTANEGLLDGPLAEAWFAQTSGLAAAEDRLWIADSETSSLRFVEAGEVHTAVGTGLFDFGFQDGDAAEALLQHPLGVTVLPDGSVAVCDTYNGAVRRWADGQVTTIATGLAEPSGAVVDGDHLVVVESAAHRLTRVSLAGVAAADGFAHTTQRPVTEIAAGTSRSSWTSPRRRARRSTTGSGRRPSCSSPRPRRR